MCKKRYGILLLMLVIMGLFPIILYPQISFHRKILNRETGIAIVPSIYRSYCSAYIDMTKQNNIYVWQENEFELYKELFLESSKPEHLLTEFTLYPTSAFSAWINENHNDTYNVFNIYKDYNLIESASGGSQEPWSISLFIGQLAAFLDLSAEEELVVAGSGATGLVLTGGLYQIFDNFIVKSKWARLEWKLKGEGSKDTREQSWDIKFGYRWYGISEISNTTTLIVSRSKTDRKRSTWKLNKNSITEIELQLPVNEIDIGFSRILFSYGKVFPLRNHLVGINIGFEYQNRKEYLIDTHSFSKDNKKDLSFILQPILIL